MAASGYTEPNVERKRGYRRTAEFMAFDLSTMILPRFRAANLYSLLLLQAEVAHLEEALNEAITTDDKSQGEEKQYSCNWTLLKEKGQSTEQWRLSQELREKLAEYNQALAHQIMLNKQEYPHPHDMKILRRWLVDINGGGTLLRGAGAATWLPPQYGGRQPLDFLTIAPTDIRSDNVSVIGRKYSGMILDLLPSWIASKTFFLPQEGPTDYAIYGTAESIYSLGNAVTSFIAATLILVPVVVLHFVQNADWRLGVIVISSLLFTLMLVLVTNAERSQIFGATAAFVAVQVVYVGSALTPQTPNAT